MPGESFPWAQEDLRVEIPSEGDSTALPQAGKSVPARGFDSNGDLRNRVRRSYTDCGADLGVLRAVRARILWCKGEKRVKVGVEPVWGQVVENGERLGVPLAVWQVPGREGKEFKLTLSHRQKEVHRHYRVEEAEGEGSSWQWARALMPPAATGADSPSTGDSGTAEAEHYQRRSSPSAEMLKWTSMRPAPIRRGKLREALLGSSTEVGSSSPSMANLRLGALADVLESVCEQVLAGGENHTARLGSLLETLRSACKELMKAETASLFLLTNTARGEQVLWTKLNTGEEIELNLESGLAGWCARHQQEVTVENAYQDERFDSRVDAFTGFTTRNVLCEPVKDGNGDLLGVLEVVNKGDGSHFTGDDLSLLRGFAFLASVAIVSAEQLHSERIAERRYDALSRLSRHILCNLGLRAIFAAVYRDAPKLVASKRAMLFLLDGQKGAIWTEIGGNPTVLPLWTGKSNCQSPANLVARVVLDNRKCTAEDGVEGEDLANDASLNAGKASDDTSCPTYVAAAPVANAWAKGALGAIVAVDRAEGVPRAFDAEELELLDALARYTGSAIANAAAFGSIRGSSSTEEGYLYWGCSDRKPRSASIGAGSPVSLGAPASHLTRMEKNPTRTSDEAPISEMKLPDEPNESKIRRLWGGNIVSWAFDPLDGGVPKESLPQVCTEIIRSWGVESGANMKEGVLDRFVEAVASHYRENQFHSFAHAASVLQAGHMVLKLLDSKTRASFTLLDALCFLVACLCHDVGHPGTTNSFQVNSLSPLAIKYNDQSVLENYHSALTFEIMLNSHCNISSGLTGEEFRQFRHLVCTCIMMTDFTFHDKHLAHLSGMSKMDSEIDTLLLLPALVHASDLSNPTRPYALAQRWAKLVAEEFKAQANLERDLGLPVKPFMEQGYSPSNEVFFISGFCLPLWQAIAAVVPGLAPAAQRVNSCLDQLRKADDPD